MVASLLTSVINVLLLLPSVITTPSTVHRTALFSVVMLLLICPSVGEGNRLRPGQQLSQLFVDTSLRTCALSALGRIRKEEPALSNFSSFSCHFCCVWGGPLKEVVGNWFDFRVTIQEGEEAEIFYQNQRKP